MVRKFSLFLIAFVSLFLVAAEATSPEKAKVVLTKANTLVFDSEFSDESVAAVLMEARELNDKLSAKKPLYLVLNSPGGSIEAGLELVDNLNALGRTIHTVSIFSASMGFQTIQGIPGTRYLTRTGTLMSHKAKGGFSGEFPGQLESRYRYYLRRITKLDEQTVARSKGLLTLQSYQALYENEYWCEGQDCVDKGLADEAVLVACDKSLNGTRKVVGGVSFMGIPVQVTVLKAACPTITGAISKKVNINGKTVDLHNLPTLTDNLDLTSNQVLELKTLIEKKIEQINPSKQVMR